MKKTLSILLAAMMLLAVLPVCADELYIKTHVPKSYTLAQFLEDDIYPVVRLTKATKYVLDNPPEDGRPEIRYLSFDAPEGAEAARFELDYAHFVDDVNKVQYSYQIRSETLEQVRERWQESGSTVVEGPEGALMYYSNVDIVAVMEVPEYGEKTILRITITPDFYKGFHVSDETNARLLLATMVPEIIRVKAAMHIELYNGFWNAGMYRGVELPNDWDTEYAVRTDFAQTDAPWARGPFTVTDYDGDTGIEGIYQYGEGPKQYTEVEIKTEMGYSTAVSYLNDGNERAREITLPGGGEWFVYDYDSHILYASKELNGPSVRSDSNAEKPFYFSLKLKPADDNVCFTDEEVMQVLEAYDRTIEELFIPILPEIVIPEF